MASQDGDVQQSPAVTSAIAGKADSRKEKQNSQTNIHKTTDSEDPVTEGTKHTDPEKAKSITNVDQDGDDYDVRKEDHFGEATVIKTAKDLVTHVLHVDDDPTKSPWTFRAILIGKFGIVKTALLINFMACVAVV